MLNKKYVVTRAKDTFRCIVNFMFWCLVFWFLAHCYFREAILIHICLCDNWCDTLKKCRLGGAARRSQCVVHHALFRTWWMMRRTLRWVATCDLMVKFLIIKSNLWHFVLWCGCGHHENASMKAAATNDLATQKLCRIYF